MFIKRGRLIFNEEDLQADIRQLRREITRFFENDERFSKYEFEINVDCGVPFEYKFPKQELVIEFLQSIKMKSLIMISLKLSI